MSGKAGRKRVVKATLSVIFGIIFIVMLWIGLSMLFSAVPPIHYVTSCSMYPEYSRADVLLVLPIPPSAPIEEYDGLLSTSQPWVVSYGNETVSLNASISTYCNNSAEQMCRNFYSNATGFSETNGPVTYEYANCNKNRNDARTEPCVSLARVGNANFATTQKPQAIIYSGRVFSGATSVAVIHRAFFGVRDASGNVYFFTKGDANTLFDSQSKDFFSLNSAAAANASSVRGVVVAKIPLAGELLRNYRGIEDCQGGNTA